MLLFTEKTLSFLRNLKENNTREWFDKHKAEFQKNIQQPAKTYLEGVCLYLKNVSGKTFTGKNFGIQNTTRFNDDNAPYNTYIRMMFFSQNDISTLHPSFFLSIEPEAIFFGVGNYQFTPQELRAFRDLIIDNELGIELDLLISQYKADNFILNESVLARVPTGYDRTHPRAYLLKHKGFAMWKKLTSAADVINSFDTCEKLFKHLFPLFKLLENYTPKD